MEEVDRIIEFLEETIAENGKRRRLISPELKICLVDKMSEDPVEIAVRKMESFIKEYNRCHEDLKKELRLKLKEVILECAKTLKIEEAVEKVYV